MPPALYFFLRDRFLAQVAQFFVKVASSFEAPEKTSFGDIDLIVAEPKMTPFYIETLAEALNAERTIVSKPSCYLAIPYPGLEGNYVQVDVHICEAENFAWEVFHQSHGDMWNLLGSSIRPFGLTANDTGLHLRIPEIEQLDRKRSMVFLTADPDSVLEFLHLDKATFSQPFGTVTAMFEFACTNRLFRSEAYVKGNLKANDRKRMAQRDLYRRFVDDFVPKMPTKVGEEDGTSISNREEVFEEALERFGKRFEYESRVREWRKEREELARKQGARQWRKEEAEADEAYANAWIGSLKKAQKRLIRGEMN
ncbi:MAG: hypothetical protein Q9201_005072 [Fulgogasparrea decipioides]